MTIKQIEKRLERLGYRLLDNPTGGWKLGVVDENRGLCIEGVAIYPSARAALRAAEETR